MTAPVVTLVADSPRHPYLVRAYRNGVLVGYAVMDQFGWAVVACRRKVYRPRLRRMEDAANVTIDRYEKCFPGETPTETRQAAMAGLTRFAFTGSTGDVSWP